MKKIKDNNIRVNVLELFLYLVGYTIIFILVTNLFDSIYIDNTHNYLYSILVVIIIFILNKTIKPLLFTLTIPITGITLGLFYPFINLFILKICDWILGKHFNLTNFWISLLVATLLSVINFIVGEIIIKPMVKGVKRIWEK